jgi:hypothetical protein
LPDPLDEPLRVAALDEAGPLYHGPRPGHVDGIRDEQDAPAAERKQEPAELRGLALAGVRRSDAQDCPGRHPEPLREARPRLRFLGRAGEHQDRGEAVAAEAN